MSEAFTLIRLTATILGYVVGLLWAAGALGLGDFVLTFKVAS